MVVNMAFPDYDEILNRRQVLLALNDTPKMGMSIATYSPEQGCD